MAFVSLDGFDESQLDKAAPKFATVEGFDPSQLDRPPVAQMEGLWRAPAIIGSNLAKGALEGAGAIGDLQNLMQRAVNPLADALARQLGFRPSTEPTSSRLSSEAMTGYGRQVGAVDRPELQPQGPGEKIMAATAEGAGSMLPYAGLSSGGMLASAGRALAQGGAGGAAGEVAAEAVPAHPILARLGGNIAGAVAGGKLFDAGNRIAGAAQGASTPTLDAYRNLGVDPTLAGDVTGSPGMQMVQAFASKAPGGAGRMHEASGRAVDQWGNALEATADNLGSARTLQQAGEAVQNETGKWLSGFKNASRQAWSDLDQQIPQNTPVPFTNYERTLNDVRTAMPNAPNTAQVLQSSLNRDLLLGLIKDKFGGGGPLTWQDVKAIRSQIGARLEDPQMIADAGTADLKRLYGALTEDMKSAAAAQGPQAAAAFDNAAALTRNGHAFVDNVLSRLVRGNQIAPEQAASAALASAPSGGTLLGEIRREMPAAADELAAYKLRDMGAATAGVQNAEGTRLSPGTFVTDKAKLSPEALNALFAADPDALRRLNDLATVAGSMKSTERFLNTSNTGAHGAMGAALGGIAGMIPAGLTGYAHFGLPGALVSAAGSAGAPFLPGWLASRASTSPALTSIMAAPAAAPVSAGLLSRAAVLPPALRALLPYGVGLQ